MAAAVEVESLLLKVVQSVEVSNPLFEADEFGILKVWTEPEDVMVKSFPEVPVAKVWVDVVRPLRDVRAADRKLGVIQVGAPFPPETRYWPEVPVAE